MLIYGNFLPDYLLLGRFPPFEQNRSFAKIPTENMAMLNLNILRLNNAPVTSFSFKINKKARIPNVHVKGNKLTGTFSSI